MQPNNLSATVRTRKTLRDHLIESYPGIENDERALIDTLAGIDDLEEQIVAVLRLAVEREHHAGALGDLIDTMAQRKSRLLDGAQSMRVAAMEAMQEAGLPKIWSPDMTVSVGRAKPKVVIVAPDKIPDDLCKIVRTPDKTQIGKALAKGEVPGAALGNGSVFLTVRMS